MQFSFDLPQLHIMTFCALCRWKRIGNLSILSSMLGAKQFYHYHVRAADQRQTKLGDPPEREVEQGLYMVVNHLNTHVGDYNFWGLISQSKVQGAECTNIIHIWSKVDLPTSVWRRIVD